MYYQVVFFSFLQPAKKQNNIIKVTTKVFSSYHTLIWMLIFVLDYMYYVQSYAMGLSSFVSANKQGRNP